MPARVAIIATGEMGNAVGRLLREGGASVTTCLAGRSARSHKLAEQAGITAVADDDALVAGCDVFLSIIPPGESVALAQRIAAAIKRTGAKPVFVECNAVSPATMRRVAEIIGPTGATLVDVGIIGPPPAKGRATKFYAAGPQAPAFDGLTACGLDVRWVSTNVGDASALKMSYGGITKGLQALATLMLVSAKRNNVDQALAAELADSQAALVGWLDRSLTGMPPKAYRWVAEMEEGAKTLESVGLPPQTMEGAARLYTWIATTPLGKETPETRAKDATRTTVVEGLAAALAKTDARAAD
jgi:3-hydroxyisobutyrate dehydrogenase-like beta-hydroxyacid dehydrogenase